LLFVQAAGDFLAVPGNKWHGIAVIQQFNCLGYLIEGYFQFGGDNLQNLGLYIGHKKFSSFFSTARSGIQRLGLVSVLIPLQ